MKQQADIGYLAAQIAHTERRRDHIGVKKRERLAALAL
jgi:hypothetical protein